MKENTTNTNTNAEDVKVEDMKAEKKFSWSSLVPSKRTMLIGGAIVATAAAAVATYWALGGNNATEVAVTDVTMDTTSTETI